MDHSKQARKDRLVTPNNRHQTNASREVNTGISTKMSLMLREEEPSFAQSSCLTPCDTRQAIAARGA